MEEFKGTKGEWVFYNNSHFMEVRHEQHSYDHVFNCSCFINRMDGNGNLKDNSLCDENIANAKLIAASPDLLQMLLNIYNIENEAFKLDGFDVKKLKSEIKEVLEKAL